ncbi:MAG: helix-turn-helix domain-containing protein [Lachnospiraceae bacterium]|nr:helix-turn-helix domain-containing protein [Lachnospiraceae bacterium]
MALGEEIRQAREEKNLSQEDLAEQLGVSRQAMQQILLLKVSLR